MLDWAADEGWNPGLDDAAPFHAADPAGFFVAEAGGAPVAAISVVVHSGAFAFLGLYLCRPDWRGRGIGYGLWQHALAHAGGRTVGLDGVAAQQSNYAKSGFVLAGATSRYSGLLAPETHPEVRAAVPDDAPALARLDAEANGIERPAFLATWLAPSETRRTVVLVRDGIAGVATARLCRYGAKVGPIVAPTPEDALALAAAALAEVTAAPLVTSIDLPEANAALAGTLTTLGFENSFTTARMYRGPAPDAGPTLQAIATMELG